MKEWEKKLNKGSVGSKIALGSIMLILVICLVGLIAWACQEKPDTIQPPITVTQTVTATPVITPSIVSEGEVVKELPLKIIIQAVPEKSVELYLEGVPLGSEGWHFYTMQGGGDVYTGNFTAVNSGDVDMHLVFSYESSHSWGTLLINPADLGIVPVGASVNFAITLAINPSAPVSITDYIIQLKDIM